MRELKGYVDQFWRWGKEWWARSLAMVIVTLSSFFFGNAYQMKQITDDCKIMQVFRDGIQPYSCQVRAR